MAKTVIVVPTKDFIKKKESYEFHWTIPNWREVWEDPDLVNNQKIILESDSSSRFQTKWRIGLKTIAHNVHYPHSYLLSEKAAQVYWHLFEVKGAEQKLTATIRLQLLSPETGVPRFTKTITQHVELGDIVEMPSYLFVKPYLVGPNSSLIDSNGSVKYTLLLSLESYESHQIERFSRTSNQLMCKNLAALLRTDGGDVKIISSDGVTISAHKYILRVQCPVFAAMFNSETSTGLVKMDDVCEKTIKILLHYFYTSKLLPTWRDEDTIVEFTYAAGKFEMSYVLELLDDLLGTNVVDLQITYSHVQLLSLAEKLSLKSAEMRLLQQIKDKVMNVKASHELFKLFGLELCKIEKGCGKYEDLHEWNGKKFGVSSILKIVDYALGNSEYQQLFNTQGLQVLAEVQKDSLKNVEKILLKRYAEKASRVQSADELFAIFGLGKNMGMCAIPQHVPMQQHDFRNDNVSNISIIYSSKGQTSKYDFMSDIDLDNLSDEEVANNFEVIRHSKLHSHQVNKLRIRKNQYLHGVSKLRGFQKRIFYRR